MNYNNNKLENNYRLNNHLTMDRIILSDLNNMQYNS